jgi:hypothetical protein
MGRRTSTSRSSSASPTPACFVRIILERNAAFTHRKEATISHAQGIALFERYDLTSLMNRFDDTNHLGGGELALEHSLDRLTALDWLPASPDG